MSLRQFQFFKKAGLAIAFHLLALPALAQILAAPDALPEDPAKSKDPKVFCPTMKKEVVQFNLNGQPLPTTIYEISSSKFLACIPTQPASDWVVKKSRWQAEDEAEFQHFLAVLGESKCNTLERCLKDPQANILWTEWDSRAAFYADCADFPFFLRAYFSFKRGLPFSFVSSFSAKPLTPEIQDRKTKSRQAIEKEFIDDPVKLEEKLSEFDKLSNDPRYTWNGNQPKSRFDHPSRTPDKKSFFSVVRWIRDYASTGTYRMFETSGDVESDFYSPKISPQSIRPGTALYKPAGHAAIIYKVGADGSIYYIDAHPDNSVSRGQFSREYSRSNPNLGGGFKNWRPFVLMQNKRDAYGQVQWFEARPDANGAIRQAFVRHLSDDEMKGCTHGDRSWPCDSSDEQYRGNNPSADGDYRKGKFIIKNYEVDYFDYVRFVMSNGQPISPIDSFKTEMNALCEDLKGRENSVQAAITASIDKKEHPGQYPRNIYGASGEWEDYSSPGRDIRIRARVGNILALSKHFLTVLIKGDPTYSYQTNRSAKNPAELAAKITDLKADFLNIYADVSRRCEIKYVNSAGVEVRMPFEIALSRLTRMSFDPYFCVERRWGATSKTELRNCQEQSDENDWYRLTQFLRNRTERDTNEVMGYTLDELRRMDADRKVDNKISDGQFNLFQFLKGL